MIDLFVGVDGTGPDDDAQYATDFSNSCVRELSLIWHTFNKNSASGKQSYYLRGPNMPDTAPRTKDTAEKLVEFILESVRLSTHQKTPLNIHLAGYSRGGAAVILVCNELKKAGVTVEALLLYDAVNMTWDVSGVDLVPDNVRYAFHAMPDPDIPTRPEFIRCGRAAQDKTKTMWITEDRFRCTHGGMGGVPWVPQEEPPRSTWEVAAPWVLAGPMAGVVAGAMEARRFQLQRHRDNGLIVEPRPGIVPDNRTPVSYELDRLESERVRKWMKDRWSERENIVSVIY
jgi:hypothetical protein